MAVVNSHKRLPLLRRPLPPKNPPLPPINRSPAVTTPYDSQAFNSWSDSANLYADSRRLESLPEKNFDQRKQEHFIYERTTLHEAYCRRGPDPLPARQPLKPRELPPEAFIKDSFEKQPPDFTLRDFLRKRRSAGVLTIEKPAFPIVSKQNFEKYENFMSWYDGHCEQQAAVHSFDIDRKIDVPDVTPRKPARQLLIEMKVPTVDTDAQYFSVGSPQHPMNGRSSSAKMMPTTPATSKATFVKNYCGPLESHEMTGHRTEDWEYADEKFEDTQKQVEPKLVTLEHKYDKESEKLTKRRERTSKETNVKTFAKPTKATIVYETDGPRRQPKAVLKQVTSPDLTKLKFDGQDEIHRYFPEKEMELNLQDKIFHTGRSIVPTYPEVETMLASSPPAYFQGEAIPRTASPFEGPEESQMSPLEAVILNAMITSSTRLNLKAHFISRLPSLLPLATSLTHLNASFNDFWVFPQEIFELKKLESLKLRDNPIKEIPQAIDKLKQLKLLDMSFNLLSSLPTSLFQLKELETLDLGYNRLSFLPNEVSNLKLLSSLDLEGNQLGALPNSVLRLQLKVLKIGNNFIHPLFWRETANNQPQRLVDLCAQTVAKCSINWKESNISIPLRRILERPSTCDCCGGPLYGQGLRVIKSIGELFRVKHLPFLFKACSQTCRRTFVRNPEAVQQWLVRNDIAINVIETRKFIKPQPAVEFGT